MAIDFDALVLAPCHAVFGQTATFSPTDSEDFQINVVFDKAYESVVFLEGQPVTEKIPVVGVRISEFPVYPKQYDRLSVNGENYIVREVRDDSHGAAKLMLNGPLS